MKLAERLAGRDHAVMMIAGEHMTAGILAGGQGRRLGGMDKGWFMLEGRPLIEHVLERVQPQCARVVISANRSLSRYRGLGVSVCVDACADYRGPLAGIASILRAAQTPFVMIVPVDTPRLPHDLAATLGSAMQPDTDVVVAHCESRVQPLHALMRREVLADLEAALDAGVRAVGEWQARLASVAVDWPDCRAFANLNAPADAAYLSTTGPARP